MAVTSSPSNGMKQGMKESTSAERSVLLSRCGASGIKVVLDVLAVLCDEVSGGLHVRVGLNDLLRIASGTGDVSGRQEKKRGRSVAGKGAREGRTSRQRLSSMIASVHLSWRSG